MRSDTIILKDLLAWYADAGVDTPLLDEPVDRFAEAEAQKNAPASVASAPVASKRAAPPKAEPQTRIMERSATVPDENAVARAVELAAGADTLDELRERLAGFDGCNLKFSARSTVFDETKPNARLVIVGEAPDRDEDESGRPFSGRAGQLLDRMLAAIGLERTQVHLANVVPWRPPGNRAPTPLEFAVCEPFLKRQIELTAPAAMLFMGGVPAKFMLDADKDIMSLRGRWKDVHVGSTPVPALATLHPGYLLRNPAHKRLAWRDLLLLKARLDERAT